MCNPKLQELYSVVGHLQRQRQRLFMYLIVHVFYANDLSNHTPAVLLEVEGETSDYL